MFRGSERREISRIEGFSDAVFGFALTLLVVALEVPSSYAELVTTMEGFFAFAICFAFIIWIWVEHFHFFRRFALEDGLTIFLNALLLFVVLFYVYPLKFLFTGLINSFTGLGSSATAGHAFDYGRQLLRIYSAGFAVVFVAFALLYLHAWRSRRKLELDALGEHDARVGLVRHLVTAGVGVGSVLLTLVLPDRQVGLAGWFFALIGPLHGVMGYRFGSRREKIKARLGAGS